MPANSRWDLIRRLRVNDRFVNFILYQFIRFLVFLCILKLIWLVKCLITLLLNFFAY